MAEKSSKTDRTKRNVQVVKYNCPQCPGNRIPMRFEGWGERGMFWVCVGENKLATPDKGCGWKERTK